MVATAPAKSSVFPSASQIDGRAHRNSAAADDRRYLGQITVHKMHSFPSLPDLSAPTGSFTHEIISAAAQLDMFRMGGIVELVHVFFNHATAIELR